MFNRKFFIITFFKILILGLFSSGYSNELFKPFVEHYINNNGNPWDYYYNLNEYKQFPYPPLMLYILSAFYTPFFYLGIKNIFFSNLFFKLPLLFCDTIIYTILCKTYTNNINKVLLFYSLSPIIIYSTYIHSQLDIIPTSILFISIFLLNKKKYLLSSLFLGLALSTKFHILASIPLFVIYQYKNTNLKQTLYFIYIPILVFIFLVLPYTNTESFQNLVLLNKEQSFLTKVYFSIIDLKLFITPLILILIIFRFFGYKKINKDLFISYIALLFSLFVLLIPPAPAWYIWFLPFIIIFILNNKSDNYYLEYLISIFSIFYLFYFIFFYDYGFLNIQFLNYKLIFNSNNLLYKDLIYTILSCSLIVIIYYIYRFSIQSNSVYSNDKEAFIIGIGGDSGSGKSTLLEDIKQIFGNKLTNIEGDGDHKWERGDLNWENFTHLDPKANFIYKQADDILNLKNYKRIIRNEYNHDNGKFIKNLYYKPNEIITLSGLHTFYLPKLRKLLNLRVFLNTDNKLRKYWKIKRDTIERGYQIEAVIESFNKRELDSIKYIQPQMKYSNFIINYFVDDNFEEDKINTIPIIKLKLEIDSNINTEILCTFLSQNNISYTWDYSENLETQYFHFNQEPFLDYKSLSNDLILNLDELISQEIQWQKGYRGIIQLFILLIVRDYKIL